MTNLRTNFPTSYPAFVIAVAVDLDIGTDELWFNVPYNSEDIFVGVNCSDFFSWGSSDSELIEPEDRDLLIQTVHDLEALEEDDDRMFYPELYVYTLFAARKRGKRPQGAWLHNDKYCDPAVRPLFEAAGPEREAALWNPVKS